MKVKATKKQIVAQNPQILAVRINDLDSVFSKLEIDASLYYANRFGWRSDYFRVNRKYGIVRGYDCESQYTAAIWDLNSEACDYLRKLEELADELNHYDDETKLYLFNKLIQFLDFVFSGYYNKEYSIVYNNEVVATGRTKKEATKDFYESRSHFAELHRLDHVVKLKDCTFVSN